ncbi:serine/threonine protein kinase [Myxococcus xanthus DK 1622]|uniref:non-specific serine/threonine protein kinase n=1 Tax=Myxococcus xanthus (strain DK1622) TaxID=246197 RepID=Q1D477_MYXXD|nr:MULTISPECIES: serine/threonine-protein kinase [Myxococcus]ABF88397.1 serine/threonine protein kinase [Myxococcus xanthus DK 1622]NOJ51076.1 protein kinase [Myxococcus xanthus]QPM76960.1 protein kinase [Myxococcus xanthus]QVW66027.1 protein kinase [Myxococcus xanthus DZ2]QZZ52055.1 Serine/threonine-protein kinase PknD [Myxococcus xanthus]
MAEAQRREDSPGTRIAGFTLGKRLGSGACGDVYLAMRDGEEVALKLQYLHRMAGWPERECAILLRLRHPNVVAFRACGKFPGVAPRLFYLAMECVRGRTLHQWVEEENPSARQVARLLRGMALGLEATHAAGVVHRDLKESNVMVREPDGEPVLVDFGVGDFAGAPRLTQGVLPPGTMRYRSPEALAFRRASSAATAPRYRCGPADDVYALGVIFYWMLTGRPPFLEVVTPTEIEAVISEAPHAPHTVNPRVPPALSELCLRLLAKAPEARGSAEVLSADVERALAAADAAWDAPLCEWRQDAETPGTDSRSEDDNDAALAMWVEAGDARWASPRRGPLPHKPPLEIRAPEASAPRTPARERAARWAVVLAGLACAVGAWLWVATPTLGGGGNPIREVALPGGPPESEQAAPLPSPGPTLAAVTAEVAHPKKEELPVKQMPDSVTTPQQPASSARALKAAARTMVAVAACSGLGCPSGPQVRPAPPGEPCPPGAVDAMKRAGIRIGDATSLAFVDDKRFGEPVPVREGRVQVELGTNFGPLTSGKAVGELIFADRVYGRFTQAYTRGGDFIPVCLEMVEQYGVRGIRRKGDDPGPGIATVSNTAVLYAVNRFE